MNASSKLKAKETKARRNVWRGFLRAIQEGEPKLSEPSKIEFYWFGSALPVTALGAISEHKDDLIAWYDRFISRHGCVTINVPFPVVINNDRIWIHGRELLYINPSVFDKARLYIHIYLTHRDPHQWFYENKEG